MGLADSGPVPVLPPTGFASRQESANPYPYSPSHAKALLRSHGWDVIPNGFTTCVKPGAAADECGAGIGKGAQLSFTFLYYDACSAEVQEIASSLAQAGVKLSLEGKSGPDVVGAAFTPCTARKACWEIADWGGGWLYQPDFYPTGEGIFATGAGANAGGYSDPTADKYIAATNYSSSLSSLYTYENYLADQLPVIWQPVEPAGLDEVEKNVCGWTVSPTLNWVPESLYFCNRPRSGQGSAARPSEPLPMPRVLHILAGSHFRRAIEPRQSRRPRQQPRCKILNEREDLLDVHGRVRGSPPVAFHFFSSRLRCCIAWRCIARTSSDRVGSCSSLSSRL